MKWLTFPLYAVILSLSLDHSRKAVLVAEINNNDVLRVTAVLQAGASLDEIQNVFHYQYRGPGATWDDCTVLLAAHFDNMYDTIASDIPSDVTFDEIRFNNVTQDTVSPALSWPDLNTGGGTGDTMPQQCCALVVGETSRSKTRGRKFLGPFIEAANLDGTWYGTLLSGLASFAQAYIATLPEQSSEGNLVPVVVHYLVGGIVDYIADITGYSVNNSVYTQRRRRPGVGA